MPPRRRGLPFRHHFAHIVDEQIRKQGRPHKAQMPGTDF
jgi:hypothetical protein